MKETSTVWVQLKEILLQDLNAKLGQRQNKYTHHENNDEDEADPHDDEKGDQVVLQRQAEVWDEDHVSPGQTAEYHLSVTHRQGST